MSARRIAAAVLALAALAALAGPTTAAADPHPNVAGGIDVAQAFQVGDVDNVNLFNGALTVTIPVGISYPVNGGFSYQLHLVANSNPWDFSTRFDPSTNFPWKDSNPTACSNAGLGWRVSLGALTSAGMATSHVCVPTDGQGYGSFAVYEAPDGSQHPFYATLHPGEPDDFFNGVQDNAQTFVENVTYTRDGTYLRLKHYTSGNYFEIELPNGNVHRFSGTDGSIVQMRDAFGNQLNVSYPAAASCTGIQAGESSCWQLSDSQGRTHWIYFRSDLAPYNGAAPYGSLISRVVLQSVGGAPATYQFNYQVAPSLPRGCPFNDPAFAATVSVPLLVSVSLPDGSSYAPGAAGYLQTPSSGCLDGSGSLTALTLPTLGSLGWTYQRYVYPVASSPRMRHTANPGVATRGSYDASGSLIGAWSYATSLNPNELVNTVTDPLGNQHLRYFSVNTTPTFGPGANLYDYGRQYTPNTTSGSLFLSEKVIDAAGILRRTDYVRYERDVIDNYPVPDVLNDNGREAQRETFYDDGAGAGTTDQDFDGVGHYRQRTTDGSFAGNDTASSATSSTRHAAPIALTSRTTPPPPAHRQCRRSATCRRSRPIPGCSPSRPTSTRRKTASRSCAASATTRTPASSSGGASTPRAPPFPV
jgi:hypothetical protein